MATKDEVIQMARQICDVSEDSNGRLEYEMDSFGLVAFAALVAAAEREACADLVLTLTCMGNAKECFETAATYIRARGTALTQPDEQIGITYEEANLPQQYCQRCGKKLGTEVTDIHTCTPKEIQPVAWKMKGVPAFATSRPNDTDSIKWEALYAAPPKKEWVGLTDKEILADDVLRYHFGLNGGAGPISNKGKTVIAAVEAKLKEKNNG